VIDTPVHLANWRTTDGIACADAQDAALSLTLMALICSTITPLFLAFDFPAQPLACSGGHRLWPRWASMRLLMLYAKP
jgi:hypothetical protein